MKLKVGDKLVSKWGYDQTNATFYEVMKVGKSQVTLRKLRTVHQWLGNTMTGTAEAGEASGPVFRRKVIGGDTVRMESYEYARLWNGTPVKVTCYA